MYTAHNVISKGCADCSTVYIKFACGKKDRQMLIVRVQYMFYIFRKWLMTYNIHIWTRQNAVRSIRITRYSFNVVYVGSNDRTPADIYMYTHFGNNMWLLFVIIVFFVWHAKNEFLRVWYKGIPLQNICVIMTTLYRTDRGRRLKWSRWISYIQCTFTITVIGITINIIGENSPSNVLKLLNYLNAHETKSVIGILTSGLWLVLLSNRLLLSLSDERCISNMATLLLYIYIYNPWVLFFVKSYFADFNWACSRQYRIIIYRRTRRTTNYISRVGAIYPRLRQAPRRYPKWDACALKRNKSTPIWKFYGTTRVGHRLPIWLYIPRINTKSV
jgi:hypothetical protein